MVIRTNSIIGIGLRKITVGVGEIIKKPQTSCIAAKFWSGWW